VRVYHGEDVERRSPPPPALTLVTAREDPLHTVEAQHQAAVFFKTLYAGQTGVLELRTFGPDKIETAEAERQRKAASRLRDFIPVKLGEFDFDRVQRFLTGCESARLGAFFGVALRNQASLTAKKGDASHCQTLTALFVDADFKHLDEDYSKKDEETQKRIEAEMRRRIDEFQLPVSAVVCSGGGLHPYWLLKMPIQIGASSKEMNRARSYLSRLACSVSDIVDTSVSEPARVLRIPGSKNFKKDYDVPRDVVLESAPTPIRTYGLDRFDTVLPAVENDPTTSTGGQFHVPTEITQGKRHDVIYKLLRSQKARGLELNVALASCLEANRSQCKPPIDETELRSHLERVWNQADSPEFQQAHDDGKGFVRHPETGKILANNQFNIKLALHKLKVQPVWDEFAEKLRVNIDGKEKDLEDKVAIPLRLQFDERFHFLPSREMFDDVLKATAWSNPRHPIKEYLASLLWDGQDRIDEWLIAYGHAPDTPFVRAVSALVLIAAVRRVLQPGCKFDEMLVLESGKQGTAKSSALLALCHDEKWFSDDLPLNVDAKQVIERTAGKWLLEASELNGSKKTQAEHLKSMVSRQVDGPVRLAYARFPVSIPRQFVIVGTTNNLHGYLKDSTGNRRFWPVRIEEFKLAELKRDRDQLWAEAVVREARGESIRLNPSLYPDAEEQQQKRELNDAWFEKLSDEIKEDVGQIESEIVWSLLGKEANQRNIHDSERVAAVMQKLGFNDKKKVRVNREGKRVQRWCWFRDGAQEELPDFVKGDIDL
jgi:predicted P-loop ATPase